MAETPWWQKIFSPLSAPFLFPPLPSGAPSNPQTQTAGVLGAPWGQAVIGGLVGNAYTSSISNVGTQPVGQIPGAGPGYAPFISHQPPPSVAPPRLSGRGVGNLPRITSAIGVGQQMLPQSTPSILPENPTGAYVMVNGQQSYLATQTSDYAGRRALTGGTSTTTGTDAYGNQVPLTLNGEWASVNGYTPQQLQDAGYTWNEGQQQWVLNPNANSMKAYWRTSGSNFGRVGAYGRVHGQRFASEQAYQSWQNRQKRSAKKDENKQMEQAKQVITAQYGTG